MKSFFNTYMTSYVCMINRALAGLLTDVCKNTAVYV